MVSIKDMSLSKKLIGCFALRSCSNDRRNIIHGDYHENYKNFGQGK